MRKMLSLLCALMAVSAVVAHEVINGDEDEKLIVLSEIKAPKPHRLIDEPEAWFDHSTGMIYIYLDTSAYNEYTLYLTAPTGTSTVYPTTSVVAIPADLARRLTYMLIESEYVGTYEATVSTNTGSE